MLDDLNLEWEQKLSLAWENIVSTIQNLAKQNFDVILDYVIEEKNFVQDFKIFDQIKYIVLVADETIILERLQKRGDNYLSKRSIPLLQKLKSDLKNKQFLLDTNEMKVDDIVKKITISNSFRIV